MRVLICAGGTGGGIYPALAAVTALTEKGVTKDQILWIGTEGEMEEVLVPRAGLRLQTISGGGIAGVPIHQKILNALKLVWSLPKSWGIIRRFKPDVMFMTGGYMAAPVTVASRLSGTPICIYLPDLEPGKSIRFSVPFAKRIAATVDGSKQFVPEEKMVVTGYPVRPLLRQALSATKEEALAKFELKPDRLTLFVYGGSRGSWNINKALMAILPQLLEKIQIIHLSGTLTWPEVEANIANLSADEKKYYRAYPFLHEEMGLAYRASDWVLARAGASMLGESPAFGLPSILVPLTFAWRYQKVNADYLSARGAAEQLTDETLDEKLLPMLLAFIEDAEKRQKMHLAAKEIDIPDAANRLADAILETAKG
ncbi:MAG: UDP-N-acetylglucosamine--N-acetylmuramyl-(pentapeptide) pyrophosphoryl-undecaprenol N-acetylglucosamine transferase [Chloroflexota bacterium]